MNADEMSILRSEYDSVKGNFEALQNFLYQSYLLEIESRLKTDQNQFFRYVPLKKDNNSLPSKLTYNDISSSLEMGKAELFAEFFKSIFINNNVDEIFDDEKYHPAAQIIEFSRDEVYESLISIDQNKGTGPHNVSPIILKNCANALALPLQLIFNRSLTECVFPSE